MAEGRGEPDYCFNCGEDQFLFGEWHKGRRKCLKCGLLSDQTAASAELKRIFAEMDKSGEVKSKGESA